MSTSAINLNNVPMFLMTGQVMNVYRVDASVNKESGEMIPVTYRIQMLGLLPMENGESRLGMETVKTDEPQFYQEYVGKIIRVAVGFFAPSKGNVIPYLLKGQKPQVLTDPSPRSGMTMGQKTT